jgi:putative intracellular protease/amidase
MESIMSNGTLLLIASSADSFELRAGKVVAAGFYLNELSVPIMAAVEAGYDFVLATPKGTKPVMDKRSAEASHFGGDETVLRAAVDFVENDRRMVAPRTLRSVITQGLHAYAGMFIPGGHPPMVDLMQDPDVGQILRHFHAHVKPTVMLCHGPISVTAAMPNAKAFRAAMDTGDVDGAKRAAQGWQYAGYKMTVFSNKEEAYAEDKVLNGHLKFYAADALTVAGGIVVNNNGLFVPNIVRDRELITGQNPPSDHQIAKALVQALNEHSVKAVSV